MRTRGSARGRADRPDGARTEELVQATSRGKRHDGHLPQLPREAVVKRGRAREQAR